MSGDALRALIVDDEPLARRGIRARLAGAGVDVAAECGDGEETVRAIRELAPDIVFLDVQMPGMDGFAVVETVGADAMPTVVFVTAYDAHALRAFEAHALDYLLKPIDDERFALALARARAHIAERRDGALGRRLRAMLAEGEVARVPVQLAVPTPPLPPRVPVRDRGRIVLLDADEITWIEADGDYVRVHAGTQRYLLRERMAAMEVRLGRERFVRIHRSAIVNVGRVRELRPRPNHEYVVVLRDGTQLGRLVGDDISEDKIMDLIADAASEQIEAEK
jgi:two-component system LytT family response regulator